MVEGYSPIHFYGKVDARDALPLIWYIIKHFRWCIVHDDVAFTFVLSRSKNQVFYDITWYAHDFLRVLWIDTKSVRNFVDFVSSDNWFTYEDVIIMFNMKTR